MPAQGDASEPVRLALADEQAEREGVGERERAELGGGRPGRGQVPALQRAPEDRVGMPLTRQRLNPAAGASSPRSPHPTTCAGRLYLVYILSMFMPRSYS
jgi:hypothetical protein